MKENKKYISNRMNGQITSANVRIINLSEYDDVLDKETTQNNFVNRRRALELRDILQTDLIELSVNEKEGSSICKLMDKDKFLYQEKKKEKERKANQKTAELKEIKLGLDIAENDFNTKLKQAQKFLERGDNVKVNLQLRGRSKYMEYGKDHALQNVLRFADSLTEFGKIVNMPKWLNDRVFCQVNSNVKKNK